MQAGGDSNDRPPSSEPEAVEAVEATMRAARALLGVVAKSLAPALEQVSFPQFRVLVLLSDGHARRSGLLAEYLGVHPSTFTRMVDRLASGGWVERLDAPDNRREVHVQLTDVGAALVDEVMRLRREAIAAVLEPLDAEHRSAIAQALETFARAAGEPAAEDLAILGGWIPPVEIGQSL